MHSLVPRFFHPVFTSITLLASALVPALAAAQETTEPEQTVVITGSRITRPQLESTVPTLNLTADDLASQGFENFADIATQLPQFTPSFGTSRTQSTFSGSADSGLNGANLRNLGSVRTVVLINGRRVPGGTSTTTSVDFNTLPTANIERIEILSGGAAAIYGADAVAGVINIITKKNFNGIEFGASYGVASEGDNENPDSYVMLGGPIGETGHGLLTIQYDKQGRVSCTDRFLCAQDFAWTTPDNIRRGPTAQSGVGLNGRFFVLDGASYTRRGASFTDANGDLIPFDVTVDGFNRNPTRDLAIPTERIMVAAEGEVQMSKGIKAFTEINFGQSETDASLEGHPFQATQPASLFGGTATVPGLATTIPLSNPFVPAELRDEYIASGLRVAPEDGGPIIVDPATAEIDWFQRFNFAGFRGANNQRQTIRAVAGLRGEFESLGGFGSNWSWEVHHVYGRTSLDGSTEGNVGTDRLYNALRVEADPANPGQFRCIDPSARALGCIPVNPFAPYTQEMIDFLSVSAGQHGRSTLQDTQAYITGSLFELPAGALQAALGVERRRFSGFLDYDQVINTALVTGNQIGDVDPAEIEAKEAYVEALVPILKDKQFAKILSVESAYRHSNTNVGNYNTWKYGGEWAPIEILRFRAMRAHSVRAPVPDDLSGIGQTFGVVNDPCTDDRRDENPTRLANCLADGIPDGYVPQLITEQSVAGLTGGNPNLVPEQSDSLTYGFVFTPDFIPNFSLTVDRFKVDIDGIITAVFRQNVANLCYDTVDRLFCDQLTRGTASAEPGATWVLKSVNEQLQNVASESISGFDIEARYNFDLARPFGSQGSLGKLTLQLLATLYDKADLTPLVGEEAIDLLGSAGGSTDDQGFIRRQANLNVVYSRGPIGVNWHTRYIGAADMAYKGLLQDGFPEIGSRMYHDVRLSFGFGAGSEIYAGVNNLFDKDPPFFATGASGTQALDTIPGYYDVFGRSYYFGTRLRF